MLFNESVFGIKYSRMDQVKFVEDSLYKIWMGMVCFRQRVSKAVFQKFYLVHFWILCPILLVEKITIK